MIDLHLYGEVVALFGAFTVRAALAERGAHVYLDDTRWNALVGAYERLAAAGNDDRTAVCATLDEPTRRALVLVLLDHDFLADMANGCAAARRE